MKKTILCTVLLFVGAAIHSQVQFAQLVGEGNDFKTGIGGFFKFDYPISEADYVNIEIGVNFFESKTNTNKSWLTAPLKAGYKYTLNRQGHGFYLEPQIGYNIAGFKPDDTEFRSLVLAGGVGYLFKPLAGIRFDLGLKYESAFFAGGSVNYVAARLTHTFSLRKKE